MRYDVLSIDAGPSPSLDALPGATEHALPLRPTEHFVTAWPLLVDRILAQCRRFDLTVLGAGTAGVELAFSIQHRAMLEGWSHLFVSLAGSDELPLPGAPLATRFKTLQLLKQRGIQWRGGCRAKCVEHGRLHLVTGTSLDFDACLIATGARPPKWPADAGLSTDERGFIRVNRLLQSLSHPNVFAAGDAAAYSDPRPKAAAYAVRAGPILGHNLCAYCEGRRLGAWQPRRRVLHLIGTGDRHALATWGPWSFGGRWVWHWKDRIDRRFMRRFGIPG
jgi:selenide,water dikinase